jgi:hypothetical protein
MKFVIFLLGQLAIQKKQMAHHPRSELVTGWAF